jgi:hypothetical protein
MAEIPLPFGGFFGENMTKVLLLVFHLPRSGKGVALGRALLCFHLWHNATLK